jgi:hypothetical protein
MKEKEDKYKILILEEKIKLLLSQMENKDKEILNLTKKQNMQNLNVN